MYVSYFNSSWCHKCGSCEEEEGRKQLSTRMFSLGRGGRIFSIHRFICLVKVDIMTLSWKTRDGTGRDFKHLLGCAAFPGQLAKRKLHFLQGMVMSVVHSSS